ncbi:hypothetical protein D3C86_1806450 [compost metagenome]
MGAAHVQQRRQLELGGQLELRLEQRLLALVVQFGHIPVEAEFADSAQLAVAGQTFQPGAQLGEMFGVVLLEIDRMQAEGGVQAVLALDQIP